jgi:endonuclease YncB( thermonuclease family)
MPPNAPMKITNRLHNPRLLALGLPMALMQCAPNNGCAPAPPVTYTVTHVVDGDTVDVSNGERVRLIGIDSPEVGQCGADAATARTTADVLGRQVMLTSGAATDRDVYGRQLRYVDVVGGPDVGLDLIQNGLAVARYDSRDGYGSHPRQAQYVAADAATPDRCGPAAAAAAGPTYANCAAVRAAGKAPIRAGDPGPKFDADGDGIGCE